MEEKGDSTAYGVAFAGGGFDLNKFIRQPQTIVRGLSLIFSLVVFGTITNEGYINPPTSAQAHCMFNQNDSACHFTVAIGVIAFLACVVFTVLDIYLPFMSNAPDRKYVIMAELAFSGLWTFLWFVCFCLLASEWARTHVIIGIPLEAAQATIAFSFFSIATWGILTYFALGRYRRGVHDMTLHVEAPSDQHAPYPPTYAPASYNPTPYNPTTYSTYPSDQPAFIPNIQPTVDSGYQPPNY
ncbi:synaptogyrin-2b [Periophthalmus magnuspinnatus]|uniref:synaptogyrin-2b n=1 Tax=Periophthalmus magnuspinnatus TaxID=409849 RepID=UPI00145B0EC2|nr:synaptogyrin-2b [Periophthalmus magnuspinnatus]